MIKRVVCFFKRHAWEKYYRGNNKICGRCGKVKALPLIIKVDADGIRDLAKKEILPEIIEILKSGIYRAELKDLLKD